MCDQIDLGKIDLLVYFVLSFVWKNGLFRNSEISQLPLLIYVVSLKSKSFVKNQDFGKMPKN